MSITAAIFSEWDKSHHEDHPNMVILISPTSIVAYGNPATMAKSTADSITQSYATMTGTELAAAAKDMIERYSSQRNGQANVIQMIPYEGAGKTKVDGLIRKFGLEKGSV